MRFARWLVATTFLARHVTAQPPAATRASDSVRAVAVIAAALRTAHPPGLSVAIERDGWPSLLLQYGVASVESNTPVSTRSVFEIGSITKELVAAAVMQLVEQKRLALDDRIDRWLPAFDPHGRTVTVRELLSHTSGIHVSLKPAPNGAIEHLLFDFEPGADWTYNNAGYLLLGRLLERVSGVAWDEYLRTHIASPLQLTDTAPCAVMLASDTHSLASGHRVDDSGRAAVVPRRDLEWAFTAGGVCSTAADVALWSAALASGRVVPPELHAQMTTPTKLPDGTVVPYGFGLQLSRLGPYDEQMHEGDIPGFSSGVVSYPVPKLTIAVLANAEDVPVLQLAREIGRSLLDVPAEKQRDLPLSPVDRQRLVGLYVAPPSTACRVAEIDNGIGYSCDGKIARRMLYQGAGVFEDQGAPELQLHFTGWRDADAAHATGWRELYYGMPLMKARWTGQ